MQSHSTACGVAFCPSSSVTKPLRGHAISISVASFRRHSGGAELLQLTRKAEQTARATSFHPPSPAATVRATVSPGPNCARLVSSAEVLPVPPLAETITDRPSARPASRIS